MFSSSRWIAGVVGLTVALSSAIADKSLTAQATAQDTTRKKSTFPMNIPMGKKGQKRKAPSKSAKAKTSVAGNKTSKPATKSVSHGGGTQKRVPARTTRPMAMPMVAAPHQPAAKPGQMQMHDTSAARADSVRQPMSGMKMPPA